MTKCNAANERVKRCYLQFLKEAKGRDDASIDAVAKAIDRLEHSKHRDFAKFHIEQARAFKTALMAARNARTGNPLSASTIHSTLAALKAFFAWLAQEPGYRARIKFADAEYFNAPDNLSRLATAAIQGLSGNQANSDYVRRIVGRNRNRETQSRAHRVRDSVRRPR